MKTPAAAGQHSSNTSNSSSSSSSTAVPAALAAYCRHLGSSSASNACLVRFHQIPKLSMPGFFERCGHTHLVHRCHLMKSQCAAFQAASRRDKAELRKVKRHMWSASTKHAHRNFKLKTRADELQQKNVELRAGLNEVRAMNTKLRGFMLTFLKSQKKLGNSKAIDWVKVRDAKSNEYFTIQSYVENTCNQIEQALRHRVRYESAVGCSSTSSSSSSSSSCCSSCSVPASALAA